MKKICLPILAVIVLMISPATFAQLNAVTCEPEWGALLQELGGDKISVYSATTAFQDPHHIQARPGLIARVRNADLLVCTGAELEVGWLPILLRQSGNNKIQPGQPGYFEAAGFVPKLELPTQLDRAAGDVHASGNPHIQTDPRNIALVATALSQRLAQVDTANAAYYQTRYRDFAARWQAALQRWNKRAAPLKGMAIVAHHKSWAYLNNWLGLREVAELEPKPGVEPTATHLQEVLDKLKRDPAKAIIRSAYEDNRASEWLAQRARIPAVLLPFTVGGSEQAKDLFGLFDDTLARLLKVSA
jgi:zinc/manganese transport system substrate-binding protein